MPLGDSLILLAAVLALFVQGSNSTIKPQNSADMPDVRRIVESSIAATQHDWQTRIHYTYTERDRNRRLDAEGNLTSEDVDLSKCIQVDGVPFDVLVERNGQPPPAEEQRKQKANLDKLKRSTAEQRAERVRRQQEDDSSLVLELPKAFDFQLLGEEIVDGRPAWVLQATPHRGYQAQGKYGKMFPRVEGKLWVDKQDLGWVKADGHVIQPISFGLFLVRVLPGSHITMEQMRLGNGIRMPAHVEVRAAARIFFVKSLVIDRILTYSEYRLP
jgi:hypothetical protein